MSLRNKLGPLSIYDIDDDFANWAFGDAWDAYLVFDKKAVHLIEAWNSRHGHIFNLDCTGNFKEDMDRMKEAWLYNEQ